MNFDEIRQKAMAEGVSIDLLKMTYEFYMTRDTKYPEPVNYASTMSHYMEEFASNRERAKSLLAEFQEYRRS